MPSFAAAIAQYPLAGIFSHSFKETVGSNSLFLSWFGNSCHKESLPRYPQLINIFYYFVTIDQPPATPKMNEWIQLSSGKKH